MVCQQSPQSAISPPPLAYQLPRRMLKFIELVSDDKK
jgi:hypothetical protein